MEDEHGRFGFAVPDEEVNLCINQLTSSVGTYFWGRRMYEAMVCWETAHAVPNLAAVFARLHAAMAGGREDRYSRTLAEPRSVRTRNFACCLTYASGWSATNRHYNH